MLMKPGITVPFFDWSGLWGERADEFQRIITETAAAGAFILRGAVDEFEAKLSRLLGVKHVIGASDGTNAMLLGLRASGLEPGDEVILPSHSFIAAAQAIHFAGGVPVPVDLLEEDGLIDPQAVRAAVTPRTQAIMPVHVNGRVCEMDAIGAIAAEHGLDLYEDAAQALGARFGGHAAGTFGAWGAFSFYPSKSLGCFGDAGALVTDDDDLASAVRAMRNHGAEPGTGVPHDCGVWGTNSRIDNIHAAVLAYKLDYYEQAIARRREIASRYHAAFAPLGTMDLPPPPDSDPARFDIFQNYELRCDGRGALRAHLATRGIGAILQWGGTPLHRFRNLGFDQQLPRTDRFFERSLLLPMNHLLDEAQVDHVIAAVREYFA